MSHLSPEPASESEAVMADFRTTLLFEGCITLSRRPASGSEVIRQTKFVARENTQLTLEKFKTNRSKPHPRAPPHTPPAAIR